MTNDIPDKLLLQMEVLPNGCIVWTGSTRGGYGSVWVDGRMQSVHRFVYERLVGPIPEGLQLDHKCHGKDCPTPGQNCPHRRCCNPYHLEPVTAQVNLLRGQTGAGNKGRQKTHCKRGHPLAGDNLYTSPTGVRTCRSCRRVSYRNYEHRGRKKN